MRVRIGVNKPVARGEQEAEYMIWLIMQSEDIVTNHSESKELNLTRGIDTFFCVEWTLLTVLWRDIATISVIYLGQIDTFWTL